MESNTDDTNDSILEELDRALKRPGAEPLAALVDLLQSQQLSAHVDVTNFHGRSLSGYRLVRLLGVGGMGATYLAESEDHERVAVKVVGALSLSLQARFEGECRVLRKLSHPGIVRYLDHGTTEEGCGFLVMDLIPGRTLQAVLEEIEGNRVRSTVAKALLGESEADPADLVSQDGYRHRVVEIVSAVSDALSYAHELGVVHRDIKPANILIDDDLKAVVIDFGLARDLFRDPSLTRSGAVMGTISYMAPEQLRRGDEADPRTDVFALGLVLFWCLVGTDLRVQIADVVRGHVRILEITKIHQLPDGVRAVLFRCLEHQMKRRYQSAAELSADLRRHLRGQKVQARIPSQLARTLRTMRGRVGILLLASAVALAVSAAIWLRPPDLLWVDAIYDNALVTLDGEQQFKTPLAEPFIVSRGTHTVELKATWSLPVRVQFDVERRYNRVTLPNVHTGIQAVEREFYSGDDAAYLLVLGGEPGNLVHLGEAEIPAIGRWMKVAPGTHRIRSRNAFGFAEEQIVHAQPGQLNLVHLMHRGLAKIPGKFRYTLGVAISPRPDYVSFALDDGAVFFMNDGQQKNGLPDGVSLHTMITSVCPQANVNATLRVDFPEPMKSLVFCHSSATPDLSRLKVEFRIEGRRWQEVRIEEGGHRDLTEVGVGPQGTRCFELRAGLRIQQRPSTYSTLRFLDSYFDHEGEADWPCFGIVADPKPNVSVLQK